MTDAQTKCPRCGAEKEYSDAGFIYFECGSSKTTQSDLCAERVANAATRKELEQFKAECGIAHDQRRDAENERRNETHRAELAESRIRELSAYAESWRKQSEMFEKRLLASDARVRELEGLEVDEVDRNGDWVRLRTVGARTVQNDCDIPTTLGEAMPRKEGV